MIKRAILYTICIFLLGSINSCKKKKHVHIKGRVYNPITNEGIKDVELWLLKSTTMEFPGGNEGVATIYTDEDGYFEMDEYSKEATKLRIGHMPGDYYKIGWYQNGVQLPSDLPVKRGETQYADFQAVPYGSIELHVKNVSCFNGQDKVSLYFDGETVPSNTYNEGLMTTLSGCVDITDPPLKCTIGNKYFHWVSTKNNITTTYYDTVFVDENTTATIDVFY